MIQDAWRKYRAQLDWVEELFYLVVLATEACMIYPWQLLVSSLFQYQGLSLWGVCLLLWGPYLVVSVINRAELSLDRKQALVAGLMIVGTLIAVRFQTYGGRPLWDVTWIGEMVNRFFNVFVRIPPDLGAVILAFVGWWRGIVAARHEYDNQKAWYHFRIGVVILFGYFLVTIFGHRVDLTGGVLAFFFFGLMSIALARILELGGIHQSTLGSKQWVAVLIGSTLGSLGLALLVSLIFSRRTLQVVLGWFRPFRQFLGNLVWFLFSLIFYLAWPLMEWLLSWIQQAVTQGTFEGLSPLLSPFASSLNFVETEGTRDPTPVCRTIFVILVVVGGLFLIARAIRRIAQRQAERGDLERESLLSGQDVAADLKNSLQQGWAQIKAFASQFGGRHRRSAASIRKIYASMVDLATEAGYPRRPAETPYEYRSTLYQAFVGGQDPVDTITQAYVRVHYGQVPDTQEEMDHIVQCWYQVQQLVAPKQVEEQE